MEHPAGLRIFTLICILLSSELPPQHLFPAQINSLPQARLPLLWQSHNHSHRNQTVPPRVRVQRISQTRADQASALSRMRRVVCLLDGNDERTTLDAHTTWITTQGKRHGLDPRHSSMLENSVQPWRTRLKWSGRGIKIACCPKIAPEQARQRFQSDSRVARRKLRALRLST